MDFHKVGLSSKGETTKDSNPLGFRVTAVGCLGFMIYGLGFKATITRGGQAAMHSCGYFRPNQHPIYILPHGVTNYGLWELGTECLGACIIPFP